MGLHTPFSVLVVGGIVGVVVFAVSSAFTVWFKRNRSASQLPGQTASLFGSLLELCGYCADVQVSNPHLLALVWQVSLPMTDATTTLWDAVYTQQDQRAIIRGATWNRLLAPAQTIVFGFCATHQP